MSFEAVARRAESQRFKKPNGQEGVRVTQYWRRVTYERLKERCRARGIAVSRYLNALTEEMLDAEDGRAIEDAPVTAEERLDRIEAKLNRLIGRTAGL